MKAHGQCCPPTLLLPKQQQKRMADSMHAALQKYIRMPQPLHSTKFSFEKSSRCPMPSTSPLRKHMVSAALQLRPDEETVLPCNLEPRLPGI